ncbi:hypothetical protein L915_01607 [Phytophthora nicotianae]|uniref:Tyr recombinase domain-containing protein n=1 Tax=Phytophthora nicotianae TaxID=4792 RepID=W2HK18_PHYNI|nr:hypothetical protein L915_01607 [Phytophthora nicotianae]
MDYTPWLGRDTVDANAAQLGAFAVYLWRYGMNRAGVGNTYTTICSKLCAVRWFHKNTAGYDPGANAGHAILLRGIRRLTDSVVKQQSVTPSLLRKVFLLVDVQHARGQLLWDLSICLLAESTTGTRFDSEILYFGTRPDTRESAAGRSCGHPAVRSQEQSVGREELRFHSRSGDKVLCPVKVARWILRGARAFATQPVQPALSTGFGSGIAAEEVADTLKQAASAMGLDARLYSTHSIRIGGATELMNSGADRLVIKLMGRWLSNAFEGYPTLSAKGSRGLARLMCRSTSS